MTIDWLTVAAQIVNFLILVWLLKRFLYQRIIDAMARREQHIADRMEEARRLLSGAEREVKDYRRKSRELDETREHVLAEANAEADQLRSERRDELRSEIEFTRRRWLEQVKQERDVFLRAIQKQAARHFLLIARRALADLANADLEHQMIEMFLDRLQGIDRETAEDVAKACRRAGEPITVASGFDLLPALRGRITRAIHDQFGSEIEVHYRISADIACGVELTGGGRSLLWSLDGYLDSLEARLSTVLAETGTNGSGYDAAPSHA